MKRAVAIGFFATSLMTLLMAAGRFLWEAPLLPEMMAQVLFAFVPVWAFTPLIRAFGLGAKYLAFWGMVGLHLAVGTTLGVLCVRRSLSWLGATGLALTLWLVAMGGLAPLAGMGFLGTRTAAGGIVSSASMLAFQLFFTLSLVALDGWLPARRDPRAVSDEGRRSFIAHAAQGLALLAVVGALGRWVREATADVVEFFKKVAGLPSEITPVGKFYTVSKNVFDPTVDAKSWRLEVKGLVEKPYTLTYDEIVRQPPVTQYATLECISNEVGGDLISNALWKGTRLRDVLTRAGVKPGASELILRARDGYSDSFPLKKALEEGTLLAWEMNGKPLERQHGFPARVIVPGIYGMKNVKWLTELEVANFDYKGYWESRGWSDEAIYKTMSRIDIPESAILTRREPGYIGGVAFAGDREIRAVEVSLDGGQTWRAATMKPALGPYTWVLWAYEWTPQEAGTYTVKVRVVDGKGEIQTDVVRPPLPDGASGRHTVKVTVR